MTFDPLDQRRLEPALQGVYYDPLFEVYHWTSKFGSDPNGSPVRKGYCYSSAQEAKQARLWFLAMARFEEYRVQRERAPGVHRPSIPSESVHAFVREYMKKELVLVPRRLAHDDTVIEIPSHK